MTEMVSIPKDDLMSMKAALTRALEVLEDVEDGATIAHHLRNPEEGMPAALVSRMIHGESPLATHREWRGVTQSVLAEKSGVNRVQIAQIEKGDKSGSVATLKKLAEALGVTIDDLV